MSLRLLAASPKSRSQIARKLEEKGFEPAVIREVLAELESSGVLSDKAFAEDLVSRLLHGRPSGSRKIRFELRRKGVGPKLIEELLGRVTPEEESERARELARARWDASQRLAAPKRIKRVYDFLVRRGFDFQIAREIVEEISGTPEAETP